MKRMFLPLCCLAILLVFLLSRHATARTTFKMASISPPHHAYTRGAMEFARIVKQRTHGEIVIKVFHSGQLGKGEREYLEGMQLGTIDIAVTATGPVSNFDPDMGVVDLPFLFHDADHVDRVLDGPVGKGLLNGLERAGLKGLAFFENGFRNFTNSKRPLLKPADFKGLKFRTMENPVHLASVRQLGAQAVPMSWGEVYTSLQTGVIDGQENPIAIIHAFKIYEVQKYLSLTGHFYSPAPLTMSLKKYAALKPAMQSLLLDAALEAAAFERRLIRDNEEKQLQELKALGMNIRNVDKALFVDAMAPVYERFGKKYPAWKTILQKIRAAQ